MANIIGNMMSSIFSAKSRIAWCLIGGFLIKVMILLFTFRTLPFGDENLYLKNADKFNYALTAALQEPAAEHQLELLKAAGGLAHAHTLYGIFASATYGLFHSRFLLGMMQILIQLTTAWGLYLFSRNVWGSKSAHWCLLAFILYPSNLIAPHMAITENLFIAFLAFTALGLHVLIQEGRIWPWKYYLMFGIFTFLGAFCRSLLAPIFVVNAIFIVLFSPGIWRQRATQCALYISGFVLIFACWSVPVSIIKGSFTGFETASGPWNFYVANNSLLLNPSNNGRVPHMIPDLKERLQEELASVPKAERDDEMRRRVISFVWEHPLFFLKQGLYKLSYLWSPVELVSQRLLHLRYPLFYSIPLSALFLFLLWFSEVVLIGSAILGAFLLPWSREKTWLLIVLAVFSAIHFVTIGDPHWHFGYLPLVFLLAIPTISMGRTLFQNRPRRLIIGALITVFIWLGGVWLTLPRYWVDFLPSNLYKPIIRKLDVITPGRLGTFDRLDFSFEGNPERKHPFVISLSEGNFLFGDVAGSLGCQQSIQDGLAEVVITGESDHVLLRLGVEASPEARISVNNGFDIETIVLRDLLKGWKYEYSFADSTALRITVDPLTATPEFLPSVPSYSWGIEVTFRSPSFTVKFVPDRSIS